MDKEEEILAGYISGVRHGEDNKLKAAVGSLSAKRSKELSDSLCQFKKHLVTTLNNLILNNTHNSGVLKDGMLSLGETVSVQVDKLIVSNERLGKSNDENARKIHALTLANVVLTLFMVVISGISLWSIFLTNQIKNESIKANQINEQPFLNFIDIDKDPYTFVNSGKGVALNFLIILYDKPNNQLYVTPEGAVGEAAGVGMYGRIKASELVQTDFEHVESDVSWSKKLFEIASEKDTSWFAIMYEDIYGRKFATLVRGPGGVYSQAVEFIELTGVNK